MCDEIAGRRDHDATSKFKASTAPVSTLSKRNLKKCRKFKQKYCIPLRNMRIYYTYSLPSSSVVECLTVNQRVAGSNPAWAVESCERNFVHSYFFANFHKLPCCFMLILERKSIEGWPIRLTAPLRLGKWSLKQGDRLA